MTTDPDNGYFVVVLPQFDFFQGFFLPKGLEQQADALIITIREQVAGRYVPPSIVIAETKCVSEENQAIFGALLSLLVEIVHKRDILAIPVVAFAVHRLSDQRYFWILGHMSSEGTTTNFNPLYVQSDKEARDAIMMLPEITAITDNISRTKGSRH